MEVWNKGLIWDTMVGTVWIALKTIRQSDEVSHCIFCLEVWFPAHASPHASSTLANIRPCILDYSSPFLIRGHATCLFLTSPEGSDDFIYVWPTLCPVTELTGSRAPLQPYQVDSPF